MSPQRMAISSLLCPDDHPRPAHEPGRTRHAEKPRTIDALLHPAPAPVPVPVPVPVPAPTPSSHPTAPTMSQHRAMSSSSFSCSPTDSVRHSFPSPRYSPLQSARPPFAGLQALVHVASEEHRRISTLDRERDYLRHPDVDYHHHHHHYRPHKRPRASRSPSPSRTTASPNTDALPATPPPFQSPRGHSTSTSGGSQHRQPQLDSQYSHSYVVHSPSRVAHPSSTLSPPVLHPQSSPLLSHTLPSPSRHPQLHSLLSHPQTPPQPTRHLPLHRDCSTPSSNSASAPRMAGRVSLLRDDVPPRAVEISRHQEHRTPLEQGPPYLQVQAHLPVQSPIPRLPTAPWDVRQDTPPIERTPSSSQKIKPTHFQQPPWVAHLPTVSPALDLNHAVEPLPHPESPHVDQTDIPLMQQQSVEDTLPADQDTLSCPCTVNGEVSIEANISTDIKGTQENARSLDQSAATTQLAQRWPTPSSESPISSSSLPEQRDIPLPVEILTNSLPRECPPVASVPASPQSEGAVPEQTSSHPSSMTSPRPTLSPQPHTVQHEARQATNQECTQVGEPDTELSHSLVLVKNEKVEEEPTDLPSEQMVADDSIVQKPRPRSESALKVAGPVTPVVSPATQHSHPHLSVKLEGEEAGGPQISQPSMSRGSSPTPSTLIEAESHPEAENVDILLPISSPPEADYRSAETLRGSHDAVGMDIDVDEELLSLVEDRPPAHRVRPSSMTARAPRESEDPGQGRLTSRASAAITDGELGSALPPIQRMKKGEKGASATAAKKRKQETTGKPPAKAKQPQKSRTKPAAKTKAKLGIEEPRDISKGIPKLVGVDARSRSTSVLPANDSKEDGAPARQVEESDKEDDKLYCVCKTGYDEDRVMIACDKCDEWYHTQCVNMPDLEIDLVDQFTCPPCVKKNPQLRTTWKRRCLYGLRHENPSSPSACHKPCRGAYSKYCSDECGIKYMQLRISQWEPDGDKRGALWEAVKRAEKREGVVVRVDEGDGKELTAGEVHVNSTRESLLGMPSKRRVEWEVRQLNARLEEVVKQRDMIKLDMDMVLWREKLVTLAAERAGKVDECGWDQRLCFGKEEWTDFGAEVLDSYEEKMDHANDAMHVDDTSNLGEWWCAGKKKCERHAGWQKLRMAEVSFEKETKAGVLVKLTTCEREIRKRIEDTLYSGAHSTPQKAPLQSSPGLGLNGTHNS